jgi:hypothetical protein
MATISDVENTVCTLLETVLYPNGTSMPSVTGYNILLTPGEPVSNVLDSQLLANASMVAVFPLTGTDKDVTKYSSKIWYQVSVNLATLFVNISQNVITINGTVTVPQGVLVTIDHVNYPYAVQPDDTLSSIATNIAALIPAAVATGNTVVLNSGFSSLSAEAIQQGIIARESKRQQKLFYVSVFAPNPQHRAIIADACETYLGDVERIFFNDATSAVVWYKTVYERDLFQKQVVYQRDLVFNIEYPTMIYSTADTVGNIELNITRGDSL